MLREKGDDLVWDTTPSSALSRLFRAFSGVAVACTSAGRGPSSTNISIPPWSRFAASSEFDPCLSNKPRSTSWASVLVDDADGDQSECDQAWQIEQVTMLIGWIDRHDQDPLEGQRPEGDRKEDEQAIAAIAPIRQEDDACDDAGHCIRAVQKERPSGHGNHLRSQTIAITRMLIENSASIERTIARLTSGTTTRSMNSSTLFIARPTKHRLLQSRSRTRLRSQLRVNKTAHITLVSAHNKYTVSAIVLSSFALTAAPQ